ncbi:MAG: hypothetical protein R3F41_04930 [Gammaproteobacteria bacterium]|nr:hypothetical protein [Pseudomonadales bacterium]
MSGGPVFNEAGSACGVICSSFGADDNEDSFISYCSLIYPIMVAELDNNMVNNPDSPISNPYELAQRGYIQVDDTINKITIADLGNGKKQVRVVE